MKRKWAVLGIFIVTLILTQITSFPAHSAEKGPIKVGIMLGLVGPHAMTAQPNLQGMTLAFEKRGYSVAGRKIEVVTEDTKGEPDVALMKVQKLVEKDKVDILLGPTSSAEAYAIKEYVRSAKIPLIMACPAAAGITRDKMSPYYFRVLYGSAMYYGGKWAVEKAGCSKAIFAGVDYAYGRETGEGFMKGIKAGGGTPVGEIYAALGTKDFGPYIMKIAKLAEETGADCLGWSFSGTDAIAFVTQLQEYGLNKKFKVTMNYAGTLIGKILDGMGKAATGHYEISTYYPNEENAANREFVRLVDKKSGPGSMEGMAAPGYVAADIACLALEKVKGNVEDKAGLLNAIKDTKYDSIYGPVEFDPRVQNLTMNYKILRIEMANGKPHYVLLDQIPKTVDWCWIGKK